MIEISEISNTGKSMRLINLSTKGKQARVEFAGCNLKCPYCVHIHQPSTARSIEDVVDFVSNSGAGEVYLGGAEPTIHKDMPRLIEALSGLDKRIILKTSGSRPAVLEDVYDNVDGFVIEVKARFDDIDGIMELTGLSRDRSEKYLQNLVRSIGIAKDKWLRIWVRVIPDYINTGTMPHILEHINGASEVMLYQFLSNPDFDNPFKDYTAPVPAWDELETLGEMALEKIPKVILVGEKGKVVLKQ